eukprot:7389085-Prymnesium_polylepis.1
MDGVTLSVHEKAPQAAVMERDVVASLSPEQFMKDRDLNALSVLPVSLEISKVELAKIVAPVHAEMLKFTQLKKAYAESNDPEAPLITNACVLYCKRGQHPDGSKLYDTTFCGDGSKLCFLYTQAWLAILCCPCYCWNVLTCQASTIYKGVVAALEEYDTDVAEFVENNNSISITSEHVVINYAGTEESEFFTMPPTLLFHSYDCAFPTAFKKVQTTFKIPLDAIADVVIGSYVPVKKDKTITWLEKVENTVSDGNEGTITVTNHIQRSKVVEVDSGSWRLDSSTPALQFIPKAGLQPEMRDAFPDDLAVIGGKDGVFTFNAPWDANSFHQEMPSHFNCIGVGLSDKRQARDAIMLAARLKQGLEMPGESLGMNEFDVFLSYRVFSDAAL